MNNELIRRIQKLAVVNKISLTRDKLLTIVNNTQSTDTDKVILSKLNATP